jgi:putative Mn2+ efflux pump MntP
MTAIASYPLLGLAFALGVDTLRATIGLGAFQPSLLHGLRLAAAFAVVEAATTLVGMLAGGTLAPLAGSWSTVAGAAALASVGVYVTVEAVHGGENRVARIAASPALVWGLPVSLSLDNLLAGAGLGVFGPDPVPAAVIIGAVSGFLALVGLSLGALIPRVLLVRAELAGGLLLIGAGGAAFLRSAELAFILR